jgi:outer membrane protein
MKRLGFLFIFILFFAGLAHAESAKALSLDDCYRLALKRSESLAMNREEINIAQAHFLQAFGTILPRASFVRTDNRQGWATSSAGKKGHEAELVFSQAIFSGFKEFAAISAGHYEKRQRQKEEMRARQLLFADVSNAFYLLLELRQTQLAVKATVDSLKARVAELDNRVSLGKSRSSEVAVTRSQYYLAQDSLEQVKNQYLLAQELLEFLVGRNVGELIQKKDDYIVKSFEEYLNKVNSRLDVEAAGLAYEATRKKVDVAVSGFWPKISLDATYHAHSSAIPLSEHEWSGAVVFNVPLFEGTTVLGQVSEARATMRQEKLAYDLLGRWADKDIKDAYINMHAVMKRRAILRKALREAELNYALSEQDYKRSVINNLDVLTAIQNLNTARSSYIHVVYAYKRAHVQLLVAAGEVKLN